MGIKWIADAGTEVSETFQTLIVLEFIEVILGSNKSPGKLETTKTGPVLLPHITGQRRSKK
jgi:hypothetical protein